MYEDSLKLAEQIRKEWGKADLLRDSGLFYPESVRRYENISYGSCGENHLLDIYVRDSVEDPITIVSVHGGAWVYSNKEFYKHYCLALAERGFLVINFNYRLAPENPYPAALEDTNRVFGWILEHGGTYGINEDKIVLVGDSAGAHIGAQYLTVLSNPEYASLCRVSPPEGLSVKACALNCGIYDILHTELGEIQGVVDAYLGEKMAEYRQEMDIMGHITGAFPPAYVMTASQDFMRPYTKTFCECLSKNGVPFKYRLYGEDSETQYEHVFHCDVKMPEAAVCNEDECEFFREWINGRGDGGPSDIRSILGNSISICRW